MSSHSSCPKCGHAVKISTPGQSITCLNCQSSFVTAKSETKPPQTTSVPKLTAPARPISVVKKSSAAASAVFLLGLGAFLAGATGGTLSFFRATTDYSSPLVWCGILMGLIALGISILKEETVFVLPYVGSVVSLLMLGLMTFGIAGPSKSGGGPGGFPPGMLQNNRGGGNGPGNWKGGPPADMKDGPPQRGKGRGQRGNNKNDPPAQDNNAQ